MKKVAVYVRVSSSNGRQTTDNQMADIAAWLEQHQVPDDQVQVYRDNFTGRTMERPGWQACWADIAAGKVATLLVWHLDRLGRKASSIAKLIEELPKRGVNFVSIKNDLDLATPNGRLVAHLISAVAAYEVEMMSDRIKAGLRRVQLERQKKGLPPIGGRKRGLCYLVTPAIIMAVHKMSAARLSQKAIAQAVGLSARTVASILRGGRLYPIPAQFRDDLLNGR